MNDFTTVSWYESEIRRLKDGLGWARSEIERLRAEAAEAVRSSEEDRELARRATHLMLDAQSEAERLRRDRDAAEARLRKVESEPTYLLVEGFYKAQAERDAALAEVSRLNEDMSRLCGVLSEALDHGAIESVWPPGMHVSEAAALRIRSLEDEVETLRACVTRLKHILHEAADSIQRGGLPSPQLAHSIRKAAGLEPSGIPDDPTEGHENQ